MASMGLEFETLPSGITEKTVPGETPRDTALRLAGEKALAVSLRIPDALAIGADTVVDLDGAALSKPRDRADARRMMNMLNGRAHLVHTGIAAAFGGRVRGGGSETSEVFFGSLRPDEIEAFVASGLGDDKAGAYAIQGRGAALVERIEGCYSNVVGLPAYRLKKMLERLTPETANPAKNPSR
jgi:septum formation protein